MSILEEQSSSAEQEAPPPVDVDAATDEAMEEIRRLDQAAHFNPEGAPDQPMRYTVPDQPQRGYSAPRASVPSPWQPPAQVVAPPKDIKTLEDLYAAFPAVGDGQTYLRVERVEPKNYRGASVAGFVEQLHEQIPMEAFVERYGGSRYTVSVIGPVRGRPGPDGVPTVRRLGSVDVRVSGPPALGTVPREEEEMVQRLPGMGRNAFPMGLEPPEVQLKKIEVAADERKRYEEQIRDMQVAAAAAQRPPEGMLDAVREQARETVAVVTSRSDEQVKMLRDQNHQLLASLRDKESEAQTLRERLVAAQIDASNAARQTETEATRRLSEQHSAELHRINTEHARTVERMSDDYRKQLESESRRHTEERQRLTDDGLRERERLREDSSNRERQLTADWERQMRSQKETYDGRVADLERRTADQLRDVKEARDREVASVQATAQGEVRVTKEVTGMRIDTTRSELERLRVENETLRRETEELRRASHKEPHQYLMEARAVAKELLGMVDGEEARAAAAAAGGEDDGDWKKQVAKGAMGLLSNMPEIAKGVASGIAGARQANQAMAQQAAMQAAAQQQPVVIHGPPPMQQPQMMPRQQRRNIMAPPPAWAQAPAGPAVPGSPLPAPPPNAGPVVPTYPAAVASASVPYSMQPPAQPTPFPVAQQAVHTVASPVQPDPPPQAAPPAPVAAAQQAAPPQSTPLVTQEDVVMFVGELDNAISGGVVSPGIFAAAFVERVGKDRVADLLRRVSPDDLFNLLAAAPNGASSHILTRDGQNFVKQVWLDAGALSK